MNSVRSGGIGRRLGRLKDSRRIILGLSVGKLKARYSEAGLGIWVAVLNPLLVMLAISFVFTQVIRIEMERFPLFALSGIFPWMFFSGALTSSVFSLASRSALLSQFNFPREIVPLSAILTEFFSFLAAWLILYPLFVFFQPAALLLFPVFVLTLLLMLLFVSGLGLMFSVGNVFAPDLGQLLGVFMMFWFWVTPVFYTLEMVPRNFRWIPWLNPLTPFTILFQEILFYARAPSVWLLTAAGGWTLASVVCSLVVFDRVESELLKRI